MAAEKGRDDMVSVMPETPFLLSLHATVRDASTERVKFAAASRRVLRLLCEFALGFVPHRERRVETPTGRVFVGAELERPLVGVSILRSGEAMEGPLRDAVPDVLIGKILIQRDESTEDKVARLLYSKLPSGIRDCSVMLLDPMLATGGSALAALAVLLEAGVPESSVSLVCLVAAPEGVRRVRDAHPGVRVVVSMVDECLNDDKYILPGLGDFGDRLFGTTQ